MIPATSASARAGDWAHDQMWQVLLVPSQAAATAIGSMNPNGLGPIS